MKIAPIYTFQILLLGFFSKYMYNTIYLERKLIIRNNLVIYRT